MNNTPNKKYVLAVKGIKRCFLWSMYNFIFFSNGIERSTKAEAEGKYLNAIRIRVFI